MLESLPTIAQLLPAYVLVLFRIGGLMTAAPMFGSRIIPTHARAMFTAAVALVLLPVLLPAVPTPLTLPQALVGAVGELMIGVLMGLAVHLLFLGAQLAGSLAGQQAGLSLGQTYNPLLDTSATDLGQVYFIVVFLLFLALGGHRALVKGLLDSFEAVPLLSFATGRVHLDLLVALLNSAFVLGLRLGGPVLIAVTMTTITLGFLSRTMPQLNVLSVGFMVQILVVLLISALALPTAHHVLIDACEDTFRMIDAAFGRT